MHTHTTSTGIGRTGRALWRTLGVTVAAVAFFALVIQGLARLTWRMSGAGALRAADVAAVMAPDMRPTALVHENTYEEWPAGQPRTFHEAPALPLIMASGELPQVPPGALPPVADRLPENPMVVRPFETTGRYGGVWPMYGMDPNDINTFISHRLPYDGLLRWSTMGDKVLPNLAWKYEISPDNRVYTLWLRRGVRWSDGAPFSADDVEFWYKHILLNKDLTPTPIREFKQGADIVAFEKLDRYTIRFTWKQPNSLFLYDLAMMAGFHAVNYPAHYCKQFHAEFVPKDTLEALARGKAMTYWFQYFGGTAMDVQNTALPRLWAWTVTKPYPALPIVLARNPYYWKVDPRGNQLPYIDTVTFDVYEQEVINLRAINGEIGMQGRHLRLSNYPLFVDNAARGKYRLRYWIDANGGVNVLGPNLNHPDPVKRAVFRDKRFRYALSYAINRPDMNQTCFYGLGEPRQMAPPKTSAFAHESYAKAKTEYRPDEAKRLLDAMSHEGLLGPRDKEGFRTLPNGKPLTLEIESVAMASDLDALQLVVDAWCAVGLRSTLKAEARPLFYQRKDGALHDVAVWFGADEMQPMLDPRWFFPFTKESLYGVKYSIWFRAPEANRANLSKKDPDSVPTPEMQRANDLFEKAKLTTDRDAQVRLFRQIMDICAEELWAIGTVGELPAVFLVKDDFRNVPEVAVSGWSFRTPGNTAPECYAIER